MQTLEELQAKQAKELARLQEEHRVADLCPVPPSMVHATSTGAPWISYKVDSLRAAVDLFKRFEMVPFCQFSRACTSLCPESIYKGDAGEDYKAGPFACYIESHQGEGFGPVVELKFYFMLADGETVAKGHCKLGDVPRLGAARHVIRNERTNRVERVEWRANALLSAMTDHTIKWGGGGDDSARYTYALASDYHDGGTDHALGQLANLLNQVEPMEEESE